MVYVIIINEALITLYCDINQRDSKKNAEMVQFITVVQKHEKNTLVEMKYESTDMWLADFWKHLRRVALLRFVS